jgi:hypothetical protein
VARRYNRQPAKENTDARLPLAKAYVELDWMYYSHPANRASVRESREQVRKILRSIPRALEALQKLRLAGADEMEILWLLSGTRGRSGFNNFRELFGQDASKLNKTLGVIRTASDAIEIIERHPFGTLARHVLPARGRHLSDTLRRFETTATAAKTAFGRGAQWFLTLVKARLVIHVRSQTKGALHDSEISDLIDAMNSANSVEPTDYVATSQSTWRAKHAYLIADDSLDPWAAMDSTKRDRMRAEMGQILSETAAIETDEEGIIADFRRIAAVRSQREPTQPRKR